MRTSLLALAAFSTVLISNDAEAMWSWLSRNKNSRNKQDTEMGTLSYSVPLQQRQDTHVSAHVNPPSAVFQRTVSPGVSERAPHSQSPESIGSQPLAIPRSAPGTPISARLESGRDDEGEHPSQSFAPGTVLTGDGFTQFRMDGIGVPKGALMTPPSIPQPYPAQVEQYTPPEEGVFDLEDLEDKRSQSGSPQDETSLAKRFKALRTSSQSGNDLVVGSAPGRTPKYNRRKKE